MFLLRAYPRHPVFADPLFASEEYREFSTRMLAAEASGSMVAEDLHSIAVEKAVPAVAASIRTMTEVMQTKDATHTENIAAMGRKVNRLAQSMEDFFGGYFSLNFTPKRTRLVPQGFASVSRRQHEISPSRRASARTRTAAEDSSSSLTSAPASPTPTTLGAPLPLAASSLEQLSSEGPTYKLSREVRTIPDLWREWTVGLGGSPSVGELDRTRGTSWRAPKERQYYSMRKVIIDEVWRRAGGVGADGEACLAVVDAMEAERQTGRTSLDKIAKVLKLEKREKKGQQEGQQEGQQGGAEIG